MPAFDPYGSHNPELTAPPMDGFDVTPSDVNDFTTVARAFWVGGGGNVKVTFLGGWTTVLPNVAPGMWHGGRIVRIWSTGTTATDIRAATR